MRHTTCARAGVMALAMLVCGTAADARGSQPAVPAAPPSTVVSDRAAPDLDLAVRYEVREVSASGVTRTQTWRERLVRSGDQVWTERMLPTSRGHAPHAAHDTTGHSHFDPETSARWLQRDKQTGAVALRFVDRGQGYIVSVPAAEFASVGFDGRFDAAAHLVPPEVLLHMRPDRAASPAADGMWKVQREGGWTHRVLWSAQRQVALKVVSRRDDGGFVRTVTVEPGVFPQRHHVGPAPWRAAELTRFTARDYDSFMD